MLVTPKIRGFICTTAHAAGCRENVKAQIEEVKRGGKIDGAKRVLVIGASAGYGLASRIASAFGCGAATVGVIFDKPASGSRTASAGWYNTAAFEEYAAAEGLYAKTINGDAFTAEVKAQTIALIQQELGTVDLVVYSLAAPRRAMPDGSVYSSVLKTTNGEYTNKTIDLKTNAITQVTVPQATEEEIAATVKVMGGEDWLDWMLALQAAGVLAENACTLAYSYIGPALTHPMYLEGSIGRAKQHLYDTAREIPRRVAGVRAYVSVNKALVTQSSSAIPVVPLYIAILYKVMKQKGLHEDCIRQIDRLYREKLFVKEVAADDQNRLRVDDWEMREDVQREVSALWEKITDETLPACADLDGYWQDFYRIFGFQVPGVDYTAELEVEVAIPSLVAGAAEK